MAACDDRQLTQAQRQQGYQNSRTGVQRAVRPFSGPSTPENIADYINRELYPAVRATRDKVNECYLPVIDHAPSANPLGYYFSEDITNGDPTAGRVRLNTATHSAATVIRVSEQNARLISTLAWLDVMAGSATAPLGVVTITDAVNPGRFVRFDLNSMADQGAYWDLGVVPVEASGLTPFVEGEGVVVAFIAGVSAAGSTLAPPVVAALAGDGLVQDAINNELDVGAGDGIDVLVDSVAVDVTDIVDNVSITEAAVNNIQRAALTGFADAAAGLNATTSAEPLVAYAASANMSAERVTTSSTSVAVSIAVASQIEFQRAALTGFAEAAANVNATTSAEPIVTFGASANMSNERVLSPGTGTTVNTSVASQIAIDVTIPLTDGDKGDIVVSGSGTVFTIDAGVIIDADVNAAAAIAMTKTGALTGDVTKASGASVTAIAAGVIVDADVNAAAAIDMTKTAALIGDVTKASGSDTTAIAAGVIVDADVNAAAAIAMTKTGALTGDVTKASGASVTAIGAGVIVDADVNAAAAIAMTKTAALTGEVTKASGSAATVVARSTNFVWTGTHQFDGINNTFNGTNLTASPSNDITLGAGNSFTLSAGVQVQVTSPLLVAGTAAFGAVASHNNRVLWNARYTSVMSGDLNNLPIGDVNVVGLVTNNTTVRNLSGMGTSSALDGQFVILYNGGANGSQANITILHESGSSSAVNRFRCPSSAPYTLDTDGGVLCYYEGSSQRWRLLTLTR